MSRKIILSLILGLGIFLRLYNLGNIPNGFFCDEASIGVNAYKILATGKDQFGVKFPIFFRAFGEYKNPVQIYSTVPFVWLFGLNEFSVRAASGMWGILGIWGIYLMAKELFRRQEKREWVGLFSALFLAISPWHIQFSRVAMEGLTPFVFFSEIGVYFWLKSKRKITMIYLAVIFVILSMYSYFPARIFMPLMGLGLILMELKILIRRKNVIFTAGVLGFLLLIPMLIHIQGEGKSRWRQVSIFNSPPKDESMWKHVVINYGRHFSADFLFLKGDIGMPGQFITRHSIRGMGELYFFQLPLILIGVVYLIKSGRWGMLGLLGWWLMIYPTGSMFTMDGSPQATRSVIGIIPWSALSGIGLWVGLRKLGGLGNLGKLGILGLGAVGIWETASFGQLYFEKYNLYSSDYWGWQWGPKEIISYFQSVKGNYDELYMTGMFNEPGIFYSFYDPLRKCSNCFVGGLDRKEEGTKQLFAIRPEELGGKQEIYKVVKTIYYPSGKEAYRFITF